MNDIKWSDPSADLERKEEYLNSLNKEELLQFFELGSIVYLSIINNDKLDLIIGEAMIQERILGSSSKWLVSSPSLASILNHLNASNFMTFMNSHMLELIKQSKRKQSFVLDIISNPNFIISYHLEETQFFDFLYNDNDIYSSLYEYMSEETAVCYFKYLLKKDETKITEITSLNTKTQWSVISSIGLSDFYKYFKEYDLIYSLDNDTIKKLIEEVPYSTYFRNLPLKDIIYLIMNGLQLPNSLSYDKELIGKLATIEDPNHYRLLVNKILYSLYSDPLYAKRKEMLLALEYHKEHNMPLPELNFEDDDFELVARREVSFDQLYLEEKRKEYYDTYVDKLKSTDYMIPEYYDIKNGKTIKDKTWLLKNADDETKQKIKAGSFSNDDLNNMLRELSTTRLLEILVDRYFEDITYNFLINLNNLLSFYSTIDIKELGLNEQELKGLRERIILYNGVHDFYYLSPEDQVKLYNSFDKTKDYATLFYEDMSLARHTAYELMNKYAFTPEKRKDLLNKDMSKELGVDVYELSGQSFYAYVHVTRHEREEPNLTSIWEDIQDEYIRNPQNLEGTKSGASISFMSDKKIYIGPDGRRPSSFITVGFNYLVPERIAHVAYGDSWSEFYRNGVGTDRVSEIMTPETLMSNTRNYNEILYQEITPALFDDEVQKNYEKLKPDYFVCYDEITDVDVRLAKIYKIPILLIRTSEYDLVEDDYNFFADPHQYKTNEHQLNQINTYRRK